MQGPVVASTPHRARRALVRGPSCHEKKVLLFGEFITGTIAFPVPHRHYVFSLPKMLRVYFRNNRQLLKCLHPGREAYRGSFAGLPTSVCSNSCAAASIAQPGNSAWS